MQSPIGAVSYSAYLPQHHPQCQCQFHCEQDVLLHPDFLLQLPHAGKLSIELKMELSITLLYYHRPCNVERIINMHTLSIWCVHSQFSFGGSVLKKVYTTSMFLSSIQLNEQYTRDTMCLLCTHVFIFMVKLTVLQIALFNIKIERFNATLDLYAHTNQ